MPRKRSWDFGDRGGGATLFPPGKYLLQVQQIIDEIANWKQIVVANKIKVQ